jgi:glutathione S-transferase
MITVHHLDNSRSQRVLWLLEELEVPYELKLYQRDPKTMLAPAALRAVHPLGKSPVISDEEHTVAESGAILEYLVDRYGEGRLRPAPGTPEYLRYRYFLHYPEGSFMPLMLLSLVFGRLEGGPAPFFVKPLLRNIAGKFRKQFLGPQLKLHLDYLEQELRGRSWLLGDALSAADMQLSFSIEAAAARGGLARYPSLAAYLQRIQTRPAYRRALERGGPFRLGV